jgi:ribosomal protein S18 acetylase RimI-like enzyme
MNNKKRISVNFVTLLLFHNLVECIEINKIRLIPSQIGFVIEKKPKVLWFLVIGTLCIPVSFFLISKNKNVNEIKKTDYELPKSNEIINGVSIVNYDINEHGKAVRNIVQQGPDLLDDTKGSSEEKKISDIGFINFCVKYNRVGYILLLAVDAQNQKKGYGKLLLQHAMDELKKNSVKSITIDVLSKNEPAKKLYEKLDFIFAKNEIRPGVIQGTYTIE